MRGGWLLFVVAAEDRFEGRVLRISNEEVVINQARKKKAADHCNCNSAPVLRVRRTNLIWRGSSALVLMSVLIDHAQLLLDRQHVLPDTEVLLAHARAPFILLILPVFLEPDCTCKRTILSSSASFHPQNLSLQHNHVP